MKKPAGNRARLCDVWLALARWGFFGPLALRRKTPLEVRKDSAVKEVAPGKPGAGNWSG